MVNEIRTLLIDSAMSHSKCRRGIVSDNIPKWMRSWEVAKRYLYPPPHPSYLLDWKEAFYRNSELKIDECSISNILEYSRAQRRFSDYDLIVVLHNATFTHIEKLIQTANQFRARRGKLAVFLANEYEKISEKIQFTIRSGTDFLCSQIPLDAALWFYEDCVDAKIIATPHALNPEVYHPDNSIERDLDVGFMGMLYHKLVGDCERTNLIEWFRTNSTNHGLKCEIHLKTQQRHAWSTFLNRCKGIVGAESGTYFLDNHGASIMKAKAIIKKDPDATFEDVFERVYRNLPTVRSGKCVSSRHFEAIGMRACQILIEGEYNGILQANQHYISVKKDLSNLDDVIERFKDETYRNKIIEQALESVLSHHTYEKRVADFVSIIKKSH